MDYDVEREKRKSEEIRKAFREIFPLCSPDELPWAACQIKDFLARRIEFEVRENTNEFVYSISRVLCEVTRPKTYTVDMCRLIVEEVKEARRNKEALEKAKEVEQERNEMLARLREIGNLVGCNHVEDQDGRAKLVGCVDEVLRKHKS